MQSDQVSDLRNRNALWFLANGLPSRRSHDNALASLSGVFQVLDFIRDANTEPSATEI